MEINLGSHRARLAALFAGLLVLGGVLVPGLSAQRSRTGDLPGLYVTFRADKVFVVTTAAGTPVGAATAPGTVIPAGTYQLFLDDSADVIMEFRLSGPGIDFVTTNTFGEDPSATTVQTFQPSSTYTYRDGYQPGTTRFFTTSSTSISSSGTTTGGTTSGGTSSTSTTGKSSKPTASDLVGSAVKSLPFRGALAGRVSTAGKLTLTRNGKGVSNLKSGRYKIVVVDKTAKAGFTVQQIRRQSVALTGVPFVGKRTVTVDLKVGQWMFYSASGKKSYFIVIA